MNLMAQRPRALHLEAARQRLEEREQTVLNRNAKLQQQANEEANAMVALIARNYNPRRIYQWGSLLRPGAFKPYSDIDIAIEGVTDAERFFGLLGEVQTLSRFPLDIVQLEKIAPEYADDNRRHGKIVYERE